MTWEKLLIYSIQLTQKHSNKINKNKKTPLHLYLLFIIVLTVLFCFFSLQIVRFFFLRRADPLLLISVCIISEYREGSGHAIFFFHLIPRIFPPLHHNSFTFSVAFRNWPSSQSNDLLLCSPSIGMIFYLYYNMLCNKVRY